MILNKKLVKIKLAFYASFIVLCTNCNKSNNLVSIDPFINDSLKYEYKYLMKNLNTSDEYKNHEHSRLKGEVKSIVHRDSTIFYQGSQDSNFTKTVYDRNHKVSYSEEKYKDNLKRKWYKNYGLNELYLEEFLTKNKIKYFTIYHYNEKGIPIGETEKANRHKTFNLTKNVDTTFVFLYNSPDFTYCIYVHENKMYIKSPDSFLGISYYENGSIQKTHLKGRRNLSSSNEKFHNYEHLKFYDQFGRRILYSSLRENRKEVRKYIYDGLDFNHYDFIEILAKDTLLIFNYSKGMLLGKEDNYNSNGDIVNGGLENNILINLNFTYDNQNNWIRKEEYRNGKLSFVEKREITYYKHNENFPSQYLLPSYLKKYKLPK